MTAGRSPERIRWLADEAPKVRLALSLHSATQPLRQQLIPSATSMPELTSALDYHSQTTRCGLMVEYLLIEGQHGAPSRQPWTRHAHRTHTHLSSAWNLPLARCQRP